MNKEYKLEKTKKKSFITKYGSYCNENKPKVIYLRTKAKITPLVKKDTFEEKLYLVKNDFLKYVQEEVLKSKNVHDEYLANIDISSKSVKFGKVSFLRYDLYLKPVIRKTIEQNYKLFDKISNKFDRKLISLLKKQGIDCI